MRRAHQQARALPKRPFQPDAGVTQRERGGDDQVSGHRVQPSRICGGNEPRHPEGGDFTAQPRPLLEGVDQAVEGEAVRPDSTGPS